MASGVEEILLNRNPIAMLARHIGRTPPAVSSNMAANDQVERRGIALPTDEADLCRSSIHSLAHRRRARDRSNRLLDYRAAPAPKLLLNSAVELTPSLALCKLPTPSTLHHRSTETAQYCADANEPCAKSRPK